MARLRARDSEAAARFRQKPRGDMPFMQHPGQQPNQLQNPQPISPSASEQQNRDAQRRQQSELQEPTVKPQREGNSQGNHPLHDGGSSAVADQARQGREAARQVEVVHGARITSVNHPGASPKQSPNDSGTRGARVPG